MTYKIFKRKIHTFLGSPDVLFTKIWHMLEPVVSDELFLKVSFKMRVGYWPDLKHPRTFNEKLQVYKFWTKNHPEFTQMVDKVAAKDYVASKIGSEYIIPTIGVWNSIDEIDWDSLPNQFVLKAAHDSGGIVICKDKSKLDIAEAKAKLRGAGKKDYTRYNKEYVYHNVPHRYIAEKFMAERTVDGKVIDRDLADYKFYCFDGEPRYCQVIRDRNTKETIDFYDMEWNHMPFVGLNPVASNGDTPVAKPVHLDRLIEISRKLSKDIPFARIDLYVINDKEYFGEITFFPASGMGRFTPSEWNYKLGVLLKLKGEFGGGGYKCLIDNDIIKIESCTPEFGELKDYKFFCFNGEVKFFKIDFGRFVEHHANYYDSQGNLLPFGEADFAPDFNHVEKIPENLNDMIAVAEKLSKGFPFLRVDLYNVSGRIYFGELTFFPASGFGAFTPSEWDERIGEMLELPSRDQSKSILEN